MPLSDDVITHSIANPRLKTRNNLDGLVWNEALQGYVNAKSTDPATGKPYGGGGGGGGTAPTQTVAQGQTYSAQQPRDTSGITELINQIRSTNPPTYQAPQIDVTTSGAKGGSPYDMAGENAAYGAAKERTGLATQAALKSLREQLSSRGIGGSGIESEMTTGLIKGGLGELANTDRQLAEQRAGRAFTAGQADTDRTIDQNKFNASLTDKALSGVPNYNLSRYGLLAQLQGMLY